MIVQPNQTPLLRGKLILGGVLLYLLFLGMQMPVAWLIGLLPAESPIKFHQASGTAWNGAVRQVIWQADTERIVLGNLTWRWMPAEILDGRLGFNFQLRHASDNLNGVLLLGRNSLALKNVQGRVDAVLLGYASRPFSLLQPQGILMLDVAELFITRKRVHGAARIDWQGARSGLVAAPLGAYRAVLTSDADGRRARVDVQTLQGPLMMTGNGEYLPGKDLQGTLRLTPPQGESGTPYRPLLDLLGRPDASGTWVLFFNPR